MCVQRSKFISLWEGPSPNVGVRPLIMVRKGVASEDKSDFIMNLMAP